MAFETYLKIDGIDGESTAKGYEKWIEVTSYDFSISQAAVASHSGSAGGGTGKASFTDFNVMKSTDISSVKIAKACASGEPVKEVKVVSCRAGGASKVPFFECKMTNVIISLYHPTGSSGGDLPVESIAFNYAKIEWLYRQQDKTGKEVGKANAGYNLEQGVPI